MFEEEKDFFTPLGQEEEEAEEEAEEPAEEEGEEEEIE
jgi:hypothetical protein